MGLAEIRKRKETSVYIHTSGKLVSESEIPLLRGVASKIGLNLRVVALSGETYTPIQTSSKRADVKAPIPETDSSKCVPQGQAYICLKRYSLRPHDLTIDNFDKEVRIVKSKS